MFEKTLLSIACSAALLAGCGGGAGINNNNQINPASPTPQKPQTASVNVLIVGDMYSVAWSPIVQQKLQGIANITHAALNNPNFDKGTAPLDDEDSTHEAENIDAWLASGSYKFVHIDAALDFDTCHGTSFTNSVEVYLNNLTYIVQEVRKDGGIPIFGTAVVDVCHPISSVQTYNAAAVSLMNQLNVTVDNLYPIGQIPGYRSTIGFNTSGLDALADSVIQSLGYISY